jgi:hypothetical protein
MARTKRISNESLGFDDGPPELATLNDEEVDYTKTTQILAKQEDIPSYDPNNDGVRQIAVDSVQVQNNAKQSLDFLAALAMPDVYKYAFPQIFLGIWQWLSSYAHQVRDFSQLALGLPRGFSKTTVLKLFILYCILFTKKSFILYIAGTQTKANDVIGDITDMLDEPNIKATFGDWRIGLVTDRADFKLFGFRGRNIILRGAGAGSDIRGITRKNRRPDVMIFDDVQTREDADSEVISNQIENWMQGTAMKAKSPEGCLFVFLANMYPTKYSILKRLKPNPNWIKFITGGITEDGKSLWEELHPLNQLLREFQNDFISGKAQIFYAEVLNDPDATLNNTFDLSKVPHYNIDPDELHQGNFIIIDPATDKANADAVTVLYGEVYQGEPVAVMLTEGKMSPLATIQCAIKYCLENNCTLVCIESNAYQYSLKFWFEYVCTQYGIQGISAEPIYSGTINKNARILEMLKSYLAGEIHIHPNIRPVCHAQIVSFNPVKRDNTDGILDCLTYMPKVVEEFGHMINASNVIENQEHKAIKIPHESEASAF